MLVSCTSFSEHCAPRSVCVTSKGDNKRGVFLGEAARGAYWVGPDWFDISLLIHQSSPGSLDNFNSQAEFLTPGGCM